MVGRAFVIFVLVLGLAFANAVTEEQINNYVNWCKQNGVDFGYVEIRKNPEPEQLFYESRHETWVVAATHNVPKNTELFHVPEHLTISPASAAESSKYGYIFHKEESGENPNKGPVEAKYAIPDIFVVALTLLIEKVDPESFWKPWLEVMPFDVPSGFTFTRKELSELEGSAGGFHINQRRLLVEQQYENLVLPIIKKYPEVFQNMDDFSQQRFMEAVSVVLGYGHTANSTNNQVYTVMVPVLDFIPPRISETNIKSFADKSDRRLTVISNHGFDANARIVANAYYPNMRYNTDLLFARGEALNDIRYFNFINSMSIECEDWAKPTDLCPRKKQIFEAIVKAPKRFVTVPFGKIPMEFAILNRLTYLSNEEEMQKVNELREGAMISLENEVRMWDGILNRIEQHTNAYPTLMEEDELRLKKKNIKSDTIRAMTIFLYGEKRTVAETARLAKQEQAAVLDKLGEQNRRANKKAAKKRKNK